MGRQQTFGGFLCKALLLPDYCFAAKVGTTL